MENLVLNQQLEKEPLHINQSSKYFLDYNVEQLIKAYYHVFW